VLSEVSPCEPRPEERGHYTRAKLAAERIVLGAVAERGLPGVVLRPGQIFGGKLPLLTGAVARRVGGRWLVLGDGRLPLPLVYLDDVVDALVTALDGPLRGGEVIQLVDPVRLTQEDVLARAAPGAAVLRAPRALVFAAGRLSEPVFGALKRRSPVAAYRLRSALARVEFASDRARRLLGWGPRVGVLEGIRRVTEPAAPEAPLAAAEALRRAAGGDVGRADATPAELSAPPPAVPGSVEVRR